MKNSVLFILFTLFITGAISAQTVTLNGKSVAEIKTNGDVYVHGKFLGLFDKSGDVYKKSEMIGRIKPNGEFWTGGSRSGKIEADGSVYRGNAKVGKVEYSGEIYNAENKKIGSGRGVKREWLAALVFFYFKDDVAPAPAPTK